MPCKFKPGDIVSSRGGSYRGYILGYLNGMQAYNMAAITLQFGKWYAKNHTIETERLRFSNEEQILDSFVHRGRVIISNADRALSDFNSLAKGTIRTSDFMKRFRNYAKDASLISKMKDIRKGTTKTVSLPSFDIIQRLELGQEYIEVP